MSKQWSFLFVLLFPCLSLTFGEAGTKIPQASEELFVPSKDPSGRYRIVSVVRSDPSTGELSLASVQASCADYLLSNPDRHGAVLPEHLQRIALLFREAKKRAEERADIAFRSLNRPLERSDRETLLKILREEKVISILDGYISENEKESESSLSICTRFSSKASLGDPDLAPWKQLVDICTTESEDYRKHIMFHDSPKFPISLKRAESFLLESREFRKCLEDTAAGIPIIGGLIGKVTLGAPEDFVDKIKKEVWRAWEAAGVPQIIDEAGKEKPDQEKIAQLIKACRAKAVHVNEPAK